jgi:hypothetical protein
VGAIVNSKVIAVLALIALGACTNLSAVSDFAKTGSKVTSSSVAIDSYPSAARELARMAPAQETDTREAQARKAVEQTKVADLGLKTLSLYLSTLSQLADDKLVNVQSSASSIGASLKSLGAVKTSVSDPATAVIDLLLKAPLDAWRRAAVGNLIDAANEPVQKLANGLADFAAVTAQAYDRAISQADIYYRNLGAKSRDPVIREMLEEWRAMHTTDYAKERDQAAAAEVVLRKIAQAQADLSAHKNELSGEELKALLSEYKDDITKAAKLIPLPTTL